MPEGSGDRIHPQTQAGISMKCHLQTFLTVEPPKPLLIFIAMPSLVSRKCRRR